MTVTIWIKNRYVVDWHYYKSHLDEMFNVCTREPGSMDYVQVNITPDQYKQILTHEEESTG